MTATMADLHALAVEARAVTADPLLGEGKRTAAARGATHYERVLVTEDEALDLARQWLRRLDAGVLVTRWVDGRYRVSACVLDPVRCCDPESGVTCVEGGDVGPRELYAETAVRG